MQSNTFIKLLSFMEKSGLKIYSLMETIIWNLSRRVYSVRLLGKSNYTNKALLWQNARALYLVHVFWNVCSTKKHKSLLMILLRQISGLLGWLCWNAVRKKKGRIFMIIRNLQWRWKIFSWVFMSWERDILGSWWIW